MFSNLYPLYSTTFINLGRAQFLCDLIIGVPIDICAHIFQTIGKTTARSATWTSIPFCSLIMKILLREGVRPPTDGKIISRPRPISMITLHASKSHSSKTPKSELVSHATPSGHDSATPVHTNCRTMMLSAQLPYHLTPIMENRMDNISSCILFFLHMHFWNTKYNNYMVNRHLIGLWL